jgi:hypothetical protein
MEATRTGSAATGLTHSWRELTRMPTHLIPVIVAGVLAVLVGVLTYAFDAARAGAIVAVSPEAAYLVVFGIVGLIGYAVAKQNVQNGSIVAMIAGLALVVLVTGTAGLLLGLLLLAGAVWGLSASR